MKVDTKSALGRLILEKRQLRRLCHEREMQLADSWQYIKHNARHLLASELSALFLKHHKSDKKQESRTVGMEHGKEQHLLSVAWHIARPLLWHWGIKIAWKKIKHMFHPKK